MASSSCFDEDHEHNVFQKKLLRTCLVDANPNNYLLLSHLEQSGEIAFIRELELKGYVRTQKVKSLPDGTQMNESFLRIIPLGAGTSFNVV
jgi:hypothetical protein